MCIKKCCLTLRFRAPAASMRRQSRVNLVAHGFFSPNPGRRQGGKGSHFHTNSRLNAVHGLIRSPCKRRRVTILLPDLPGGSPVAGPSSLQDQRPFVFFLTAFLVFGFRPVSSPRLWCGVRSRCRVSKGIAAARRVCGRRRRRHVSSRGHCRCR